MEKQVREMYERIVGNSEHYTLDTVLSDYDTILWMHGGNVARELREIEYDMNFIMSQARYV